VSYSLAGQDLKWWVTFDLLGPIGWISWKCTSLISSLANGNLGLNRSRIELSVVSKRDTKFEHTGVLTTFRVL
jgi:hypothetical protein